MKWIGKQTIYDEVRFTNGPIKIINRTTSSATQGGMLNLTSDDGAALGDDHRLGAVNFKAAEDTSGTRKTGAKIQRWLTRPGLLLKTELDWNFIQWMVMLRLNYH